MVKGRPNLILQHFICWVNEVLIRAYGEDALDIIAVTETFLSDEILNTEIVNGDYSVFRRDRNRHGGGILLLVKSSIPAVRRHDLETTCELLWVEIHKTLFGVFYRPPNSPPEYIDQLRYSMERMHDTKPVILCGDFNIPEVDWCTLSLLRPSVSGNRICEIALDYSLLQMVLEPTRGNSILDLVFTSISDLILDVRVKDGIPGSDHDSIYFSLQLVIQFNPELKPKCSYNFRKTNFDLFHDLLGSIPWDSCFLGEDVEDAWMMFKGFFFTAVDKCVPTYSLKKRNMKPWFSDETKRMVRKKRRAYKQSKRTGCSSHILKYRHLSNKVRSLTRCDHQQHMDEITKDILHNQKPFWNYLRTFKAAKTPIPNLHYSGKVLSNAHDKAQGLNTYFTSVFTNENTNLEHLKSELSFSESLPMIADISFTENDVYEALCHIDISKASGPDDIPGILLKEGAPWIAGPLASLFNLSMQSSSLPKDWTRANVSPLFKKGNKHLPCNYRPISLTSLVVKTMERLVHREIIDFLSCHSKLSSNQHGFRSEHSCQTLLLESVHEWAKTLNSGLSTHVLFLDFARAFDSVPHGRLSLKLYNIGVRGKLLILPF